MNSYYLYEPNNAFCAFTATPELQFQISDPKGKIKQNVNFFPISQNSDLISKLDPTHQQETMGMLGFHDRAPGIKLLKIQANRDNRAYLEK